MSDEDRFFLQVARFAAQFKLYPKQTQSGTTQNGPITSQAKISMVFRFFAGRDDYDIGSHHGVHTNGVYHAVWDIVDRANGRASLKIKFPDHDGQMLNAREFMKTSGVNFNNF